MEQFYTIARATQKALISAQTEFHRELFSKPISIGSVPQRTSPIQHTPQHESHTNVSTTPTITQTELNTLREAIYTGGKRE